MKKVKVRFIVGNAITVLFCFLVSPLEIVAYLNNEAAHRLDSIGLNSRELHTIEIDPFSTSQRIDHFAASDAWSGNFVGQYWASPQKEQIARWLFSSQLDDSGSPEGIGLSLWRVNIGAGTLEQDSADISPFQRRAESFLTKDGMSFDWGKSSGQQYFMEKAVNHGCNSFLLFSNSPPVQYTKNGKGWAAEDGTANLKPEGYTLFAEYLAKAAGYFIKNRGWNIRFISPVNEPQIDWISPRQEGSPWRNGEIAKLVIELDRALTDLELDSPRIIIPESDRLSRLYDDSDEELKNRFGIDAPQNQITAFFDPGSTHYVGKLNHIAPIIAGHDYWSHSTNKLLKETRTAVKAAIGKYGIQFHQTEWCMLPNQKLPMDGFSDNWAPDNFADIQVALLMGRLIYGDLVYAGATGWGYWKAMEVDGNHALISLFPKADDLYKGGVARPNKILWALGNYSYFIRPGYRRIETTGADDLDGLIASAYLSPDKTNMVVVLVNSSFDTVPVKLEFPSIVANAINAVSAYRTDSKTDLGNLNIDPTYDSNSNLLIAPRSLTTVSFSLDGL